MRGFAACLTAGILVLLTTNLIALPVSLGLTVGAQPAVDRGVPQFVDRTYKGDRLRLPAAVHRRQLPTKPPARLIGCDPPYSALLASARMNAPGRCVAVIFQSAIG